MTRALLIIITVINSCVIVNSQDVITLKNGTEINTFVKEIDDVNITYKKFDNPNGPNYVLKKSEIAQIRYVNGSKDIFLEEEISVDEKNASIVESANVNNNLPINTNFKLKKSDKIVVRVYGLRLAKGNMRKSIENKLREIGFCCVYSKADDNDLTMDIVVHPDGASSFRFRIFDKSLKEGEVFAASYRWSTMFTIDKVVDNFINDITPYIAE